MDWVWLDLLHLIFLFFFKAKWNIAQVCREIDEINTVTVFSATRCDVPFSQVQHILTKSAELIKWTKQKSLDDSHRDVTTARSPQREQATHNLHNLHRTKFSTLFLIPGKKKQKKPSSFKSHCYEQEWSWSTAIIFSSVWWSEIFDCSYTVLFTK